MRDEKNCEELNQQKFECEFIENAKISPFIPHPSSFKILLWDIDGTLIHSNRAGAYKEYFIPTLEKVYGTAGKLAEMQVAGMTDTQIAFEALRDEGFEVAHIFAKLGDFIKVLGDEMRLKISRIDNPYGVFPGVREILNETHQNPHFVNSLLTGNLSTVAEAKLRYVELWDFFNGKPHAFGEISHQRSELAKFIGGKYNEIFKAQFHPTQFIVIGDTPNDIACAREFGAKVVAVATGRNHSADELAKFDPDVLLEDLSDTASVLQILSTC